MLINLTMHPEIRAKNVKLCREKGILLPTFKQMCDPSLIPESILKKLDQVGLWDVNPVNLYRINWHNEPKEKGGRFGGVNYIEIPRESRRTSTPWSASTSPPEPIRSAPPIPAWRPPW